MHAEVRELCRIIVMVHVIVDTQMVEMEEKETDIRLVMILINQKQQSAPFLKLDLRRIRPCLRRDELFEIANSVIRTAFDADCK